MHSFLHLAAGLLTLASTVAAHGYIVSPPRRAPGAAMEAVCGSTIYNNQKSDNAGPVQLLMQSASSIVDAAECNLFLCKGYQFDDNTDNVQSYALGETVPFSVDIVAPHTGSANVSIVNTKTNSVVGAPLISWDVYASTSTGITDDETSFSVTIPDEVEGCTTAGECVLQWYWYAPPSVDQTYEGCVDFVIGDGTAAPSSSAASSAPASSAAASSAASSAAVATSAAATSAAATTSEAATTSAAATSAATVPSTSKAATSAVATTSAATKPSSTKTIPRPTSTAATTKPITKPATSTKAKPTTLQTRTRTTLTHTSKAAAATGATGVKTPESINQCLDAVNACIATAQRTGAVAMAECEKKRSACY